MLNTIDGKHVTVFVIIILIISYLMIFLIDLYNIFEARDSIVRYYGSYPFFWYHWFEDQGPIEVIQYFLLGLSSLISIKNASSTKNQNYQLTMFWYILGVAFLLMLIEDAGNVRHMIRGHIQILGGETEEGYFGIIGTTTELIYFMILASIPLYSVIKYGKALFTHFKKTKYYLFFGFITYALAVSASFIGTAFHSLLDKNLYMITGNYILEIFVILGDQGTSELYSQNKEWISFYLMDSLVEESIELFAAGLLLSACVAYNRKVSANNNQ